jgi:hypothetical protein
VTGEHNDAQLFVGTLHGGNSFCESPLEPDWYGRFDLTYPAVSQWLGGVDQITASLESPQAGSFESGIGLIRGWVCQADRVEIQIDDQARQLVSYGTSREDTQGVCGDSNNGFGITYNWNLAGDGTHTLRAFADSVEFARVNFIVTTLGTQFLQGAANEIVNYVLPDFPLANNQITVRWSEPHQNFVITELTRALTQKQAAPVAPRADVMAYLESPQSGSSESGIGLIRGWVCDATTVEIQIDDKPNLRYQVGYGTERADTRTSCGDINNGFGMTVNWNEVGDGSHSLRAFADGVEFANVPFTVTTLGEQYLRGASAGYGLLDFPQDGSNLALRWSEAHQNFVIDSYTP